MKKYQTPDQTKLEFGTQELPDQNKNLFLLGTNHKYSFPLARIYNNYLEMADAQ
jgi:hypothetical protein